ncbi:uncharacterized protein LOC112595166 [Melanaphis sacchari]|uniref:uncharacterized protein LOC112595166 n=1 Tax=Melanaphis sacchari TaxID=742174 RepID=UPI000DC1578C|nr:uncharacterized protein LOC112595166 [Melanaphis sacchari]
MGLSSQQVLSFMPSDSWTSVFLMPGYKSDNGIYIITTNEKYLQRCNDIHKMALNSYTFEKVNTYQLMGLVAVEIEGLWCRGRMLSYNEFLVKNTAVELIDSGTIIKKQLCDLYKLPNSYKYDPLCLAIKPVNGIPSLSSIQFYIQPLLLQSELHKGYVVVNTKPIEMVNELYLKKSYEEINIKSSYPLVISAKNKCTVKKSKCNSLQELNKVNNFLICIKELKEQGVEHKYVEFSNDLKAVLNKEKNNFLKTLLSNINLYGLNNIFSKFISYKPKCLSLKYIDQNNQPVLINEIFKSDQNKYDVNITNIDDSSIIKESHFSDLITDSYTSVHNIFKNGSLVEFCYGTNIDFVFIRSYDEKKKYSNEMKQFYAYYKKKENLKIKKNAIIGDMVAATSLYYYETHRAIILDKNPNYYFCFFIDIGCKEYVNSNNIFFLLEEARNVPCLAHRVDLKNIPLNNTMQLKYLKMYYEQLYLQPLFIELDKSDSSGSNKAILRRKSDNKDIYLDIKEFLQNKLSSLNLSNNEGFESKIKDYLKYNDLLKNGTIVLITYFCSINQIYIRINTPELTKYYNDLITEVNQFYVNLKSAYQKKTPKIGEKVGVKSPSKNKFVRATISKKVNDTTYSVYYIDYGDKEYVKANNIFLLPYRFRHLPQSVIKIGLNITTPINKIEVLKYFNELIQLKVPLIAEFDEEDPLGFQKIVLRKEHNGVNIYEDICNLYVP